MNEMKVGSPPQVRGKPPGEGSVATYSRITPAGAGKTGIRYRYFGVV